METSFTQPSSGEKASKLSQICDLVEMVKISEAAQVNTTTGIRDSLLGALSETNKEAKDKPSIPGTLDRIIETLNQVICHQERTKQNLNDIIVATK